MSFTTSTYLITWTSSYICKFFPSLVFIFSSCYHSLSSGTGCLGYLKCVQLPLALPRRKKNVSIHSEVLRPAVFLALSTLSRWQDIFLALCPKGRMSLTFWHWTFLGVSGVLKSYWLQLWTQKSTMGRNLGICTQFPKLIQTSFWKSGITRLFKKGKFWRFKLILLVFLDGDWGILNMKS